MIKGALKSKTVWWNVLLAVLGGLELIGSHMTVLWGQEVAAAILMVGALANLVLRAITTQPLSEK
jgi:Zn-dependent protease